VQALFDRAGVNSPSSALAFEQSAATATASQPRGADPIPEPIEAEVLDDDAFFATLREAVHDETPLGPRDEDGTGEHTFFDADDDRSGFRDVFRRRR
jgi:hypothetical protein